MASPVLQRFLRDEYAHFRDHLASAWAVGSKDLEALDASMKPLHKRYLALACAATVVARRTKRNEYAEGVVEASHLALVLAAKGLENPSSVLLRQCIELVLKHIYFASHPVEHSWASAREDYRDLSFQKLLEYVRRTDECRRWLPDEGVCQRLDYWFSALSRHVHVQSKGFMGYSKVGSAHRPCLETVRRFDERTKELWPLLTLLLVVYFPRQYLRASVQEGKVITGSLPKDLRGIVSRFLRASAP